MLIDCDAVHKVCIGGTVALAYDHRRISTFCFLFIFGGVKFEQKAWNPSVFRGYSCPSRQRLSPDFVTWSDEEYFYSTHKNISTALWKSNILPKSTRARVWTVRSLPVQRNIQKVTASHIEPGFILGLRRDQLLVGLVTQYGKHCSVSQRSWVWIPFNWIFFFRPFRNCLSYLLLDCKDVSWDWISCPAENIAKVLTLLKRGRLGTSQKPQIHISSWERKNALRSFVRISSSPTCGLRL